MTYEDAVKSLISKFSSGNDIDVERTTILRTEWESILPFLDINKPISTWQNSVNWPENILLKGERY